MGTLLFRKDQDGSIWLVGKWEDDVEFDSRLFESDSGLSPHVMRLEGDLIDIKVANGSARYHVISQHPIGDVPVFTCVLLEGQLGQRPTLAGEVLEARDR